MCVLPSPTWTLLLHLSILLTRCIDGSTYDVRPATTITFVTPLYAHCACTAVLPHHCIMRCALSSLLFSSFIFSFPADPLLSLHMCVRVSWEKMMSRATIRLKKFDYFIYFFVCFRHASDGINTGEEEDLQTKGRNHGSFDHRHRHQRPRRRQAGWSRRRRPPLR